MYTRGHKTLSELLCLSTHRMFFIRRNGHRISQDAVAALKFSTTAKSKTTNPKKTKRSNPDRFQSIRGTHDIFGRKGALHRHVIDSGKKVCQRAGFEQIDTPIIEFSGVFSRTLGEGSDVVSKEMYTFDDRSGNSITLRPEGTAGVMRAMLSNGLVPHSLPQLLHYAGPMFRYERPQRARQRQFTQLGVEAIGPRDASVDIDVISLGASVLQEVGIPTTHYTLHLNTLGDGASRMQFNQVLLEYFSEHASSLSKDSQRRLGEGRALRILDSKDDADITVVQNAPRCWEYLSSDSQTRFRKVLSGLDSLGIQYVVDDTLVRGLDYYTHTTFEFLCNPSPATGGKQLALVAGGRYDGLSKSLGFSGTPQQYPDDCIPAIGWAAGVERLVSVVESLQEGKHQPAWDRNQPRVAFVIPIIDRDASSEESDLIRNECMRIVSQFRDAKSIAQLWYEGMSVGGSQASVVRKGFKAADRAGAYLAIFIGNKEVQAREASVKILADIRNNNSENMTVKQSSLLSIVKPMLEL